MSQSKETKRGVTTTSTTIEEQLPSTSSSSQQHQHRHHHPQQPMAQQPIRSTRLVNERPMEHPPVASTSTHRSQPPRSSTSSTGMTSAPSTWPAASTSGSNHSRSSANSTGEERAGHIRELTRQLETSFVPSVVPSHQEYEAKENARIFLEGFVERIEQGAKLLPFGSIANGFALRNSDMDLCCFMPPTAKHRSPSELVELLGGLIQSETNYHVKMLPRARIPIIKLTIPPSASIPFGLSCDIGFENRLALENTRLLLTYAMIDERLRTLVLFLKVWTKRRKINNPYRGTLSSYGYVLLVLYFLMHVKKPAVLPNLQRLPHAKRPSEEADEQGEGKSKHDVSFFDDLDALPRVWQKGQNTEGVGQLLIDFFKHFAKDFAYSTDVISIRSQDGIIHRDEKGWHNETEFDPDGPVRDLYKLCIEDPFQSDYNVARTVTKDGLYTIRGEFIRAVRLLTSRSSIHIPTLLAELCEEREDFLVPHPPPGQHHSHANHAFAQGSAHASSSSYQPGGPAAAAAAGQHGIDHASSPRRRSAPSPRMKPFSGASSGGGAFMHQDTRWNQFNNANSQASATANTAYYSRSQYQYQHQAQQQQQALPFNSSASYGGSAYGNHRMTRTLRSQPGVSRSSYQQQAMQPPAAGPSSSTTGDDDGSNASLERRVSWDGSQQPMLPTTTTGTVRTGATQRMTNVVDLHRFFQNPPTSVVDGPSPSSSSPPPSVHGGQRDPAGVADFGSPTMNPPRQHYRSRTTAVTAPSSPHMASPVLPFASPHLPLLPPFASGPGNMMFGTNAALPPSMMFGSPPMQQASSGPMSASSSSALATSPPMSTSASMMMPTPSLSNATLPSPSVGMSPSSTAASPLMQPLAQAPIANDHDATSDIHHHHQHAHFPSPSFPQPLTFGSLPVGPSMIVPFSSFNSSRPDVELLDEDEDIVGHLDIGSAGPSSPSNERRSAAATTAVRRDSDDRSSSVKPRTTNHFLRGPDGKESILFGEIAVELTPVADDDDNDHDASAGPLPTTPPSTSLSSSSSAAGQQVAASPAAAQTSPPLNRVKLPSSSWSPPLAQSPPQQKPLQQRQQESSQTHSTQEPRQQQQQARSTHHSPKTGYKQALVNGGGHASSTSAVAEGVHRMRLS